MQVIQVLDFYDYGSLVVNDDLNRIEPLFTSAELDDHDGAPPYTWPSIMQMGYADALNFKYSRYVY